MFQQHCFCNALEESTGFVYCKTKKTELRNYSKTNNTGIFSVLILALKNKLCAKRLAILIHLLGVESELTFAVQYIFKDS